MQNQRTLAWGSKNENGSRDSGHAPFWVDLFWSSAWKKFPRSEEHFADRDRHIRLIVCLSLSSCDVDVWSIRLNARKIRDGFDITVTKQCFELDGGLICTLKGILSWR